MRSFGQKTFAPILGVAALFLGGLALQAEGNKLPELGSQKAKLEVHSSVNQLSRSVSAVAKLAVHSVVSIHSTKVVQMENRISPLEEFFFGSPFGRHTMPFTRNREYRTEGLGSGFVISKEGYILTNNHVIEEADEIEVMLDDKRSIKAKIVASDKLSDVAVIKLVNPPDDLEPVLLGDSDKLEVGEFVVAIGTPFSQENSNSVTFGIVSAKGRSMGLNFYENYIQTDASINPGNSGGPLFNLEGEVVGINTAIASRSGGSQGIGFAIPIKLALKVAKDLIQSGEVRRGYLGVLLQDLDQSLLSHFNLKEARGALVTEVMKDSPASEGGLKDQDLISKVNGTEVKNAEHLKVLVSQLNPKEIYPFEIIRDGKSVLLNFAVGERPENPELAIGGLKDIPKLGLEFVELNSDLARQYRLRQDKGLMVKEVEAGSAGDNAGLRLGDVLLTLNGNVLEKKEDFYKALKEKNNLLRIERRGRILYLGF